jgi:hypothetical protein
LFFTNEYVNGDYVDYVWVTQPSTGYVYKYTTDLTLVGKTNITYIKNSLANSAVRGDSSGYDWHRRFNYAKLQIKDTPQIEAIAYLGTGTPLLTAQKYKTAIPVTELSNSDWHMFTLTVDTSANALRFYMDMTLRDTEALPTNSKIFYKYETPVVFSTNVGKILPLDEELGRIDKYYFNGNVDDVRIYTGTLSNSDIRHIYLTKFDFQDLLWNMPTGIQSYVEEIVRFFKFKMPGQKSQFYNIRLVGLQIESLETRQIIEDIIQDAVKKLAPLYTSIYKIIWE